MTVPARIWSFSVSKFFHLRIIQEEVREALFELALKISVAGFEFSAGETR
jgi:hypothetical protein